jgi:hypothetical protein
MILDLRFHRWCDSKRPVNTHEIIVPEMRRGEWHNDAPVEKALDRASRAGATSGVNPEWAWKPRLGKDANRGARR